MSGYGRYIFNAFLVSGKTSKGGLDEGPLTFAEVESFARTTYRVQDPFEVEALVAMSNSYIEGKALGKNPLCIPPMTREGKGESYG